MENHYNVALCSISNSLLLLTKPKKRPSCSDQVSILSTEKEEAMMQQIRRITRGGYYEGLIALKFGRSIPTTNLVDWNSITTIAEEILYNNEP